jgi:hypothetical protein
MNLCVLEDDKKNKGKKTIDLKKKINNHMVLTIKQAVNDREVFIWQREARKPTNTVLHSTKPFFFLPSLSRIKHHCFAPTKREGGIF